MKKQLIVLSLTLIFSSLIISCKTNVNTNIDNQNVSIGDNQSTTKFPNFTTLDLDDNKVTEELLKSKDLTIVNFWGTYCPPCIQEMPELGNWSKELPDNVQLIGVIIDVDTETKMNKDTAIKIVNETGANYKHLLLNDDIIPFTEQLIGVPTTFFIDKNMNVVAEPIIGAYVSQYKETLNKILNEKK